MYADLRLKARMTASTSIVGVSTLFFFVLTFRLERRAIVELSAAACACPSSVVEAAASLFLQLAIRLVAQPLLRALHGCSILATTGPHPHRGASAMLCTFYTSTPNAKHKYFRQALQNSEL
jgi:hypothetical protein